MQKRQNNLEKPVKRYMEYILKNYPRDKIELKKYINDLIPSAVPSYSKTGGVSGNAENRTVENITLQIMTDPRFILLTRHTEAVERIWTFLYPEDRKLIKLVYFEQKCNVESAAAECGFSTPTAYNHINDIFCRLAVELGNVNISDL